MGYISIQNAKIFENIYLRWFIIRIRIGKMKKTHLLLLFGVWSPLHTPIASNKSTYLNVYCLKHRWLLTMNITIHTLFIVNHPSYICIVLWRVRILIFKAVANFCRKGADWGQVRNLTLFFNIKFLIEENG